MFVCLKKGVSLQFNVGVKCRELIEHQLYNYRLKTIKIDKL